MAQLFGEEEPGRLHGGHEQRDTTYYPAGGQIEAIRGEYIRNLLDGFHLRDIFLSTEYGGDFDQTRLQYLMVRLRFMLLFFVFAVTVWIVFDLFTLTWEHFLAMSLARISLAVALLLIWQLSLRREGVKQVLSLLTVMMLATMMFYGAACGILTSGVPEPPNQGYIAHPIMAIALLGLFPVTLIYSLLVITMITGCYIAIQYWMGQLFTLETLNYLWTLSMMAGVVMLIQSGQLLMLLRLYRESTRDPLTGLINRRVLMKQLMAEVEMHEETGREFSLMMFDLDHFKLVNDAHGHMIGDVVLQNAAKLMASELRSTDIIARFGGEEFIAVLPGRNRDDALPVADRIRQRFSEVPISHSPSGEPINVTTSIGIAEYRAGERIEDTLNRVDDYLYRAKNLGRNSVITGMDAVQ